MSRFFSFVEKANQIILLIVLLGVAILVTTFFLGEYSQNRTRTVPIVEAIKPESTDEKSIPSITFLGKTEVAYVIGIIRPEITRNWGASSIASRKSKNFEGELVNVRFITPAGVTTSLLKADGLVLSHDLSPSIYGKSDLNICLFRCVTDDTDANRILNEDDRVDLYLTSLDGSTSSLVIKSVVDYHVVSMSELVVTTRDAKGFNLISVDAKTLTIHPIQWLE